MAEYVLKITPQNRRAFVIMLNTSAPDSVDENHFLYCDMEYALELKLGGVEKVTAYVNGEPAELSGRIFFDCYGFAQISLVVELTGGNTLILHSEYLPVLVRNDALNNSVRAMVNYVYRNGAELLFDGDLKSRARAARKKSSAATIEERFRLAENIAAAYEKNYSYFKVNCRFKTEKIAALDSFEKLQQLTAPALQYIAAHPENLAQVKSTVGVRIGGRVFQPLKTLTLQNIRSRDTYENRAVLKFLQKISDDLASLHDEYARLNPSKNLQPDEGYADPARYLFNWSGSTLGKISALRENFQRLLKLYSDALQIPLPPGFSAPQPTPIFLSVPQYNQIFLGIHEWLKFGACDFAREEFMLAVAKNWNLYEKYLLLKFIAYLRASNYKPAKKSRINYPLPTGAIYDPAKIFNTFTFEKGALRVTIYYQPVVYDNPVKSASAPNLYRNNSIVGKVGGSYYVPDFVVKIENLAEDDDVFFGSSKTVKYLIIDAKFSNASTVSEKHLPEIILKYVFSISRINPNDEIAGYRIVYGKCENGDKPASVYDKQHPKNKITPSFELVPLMEGVGNETLSLYKILTL